MSKDCLLELLGNKIRYKKEYVGNDIYRLYIEKNEIELLEKYLNELQAIKNAKPSEALDCLDNIYTFSEDGIYQFEKEYDIIKQYILKSQEQEKVLKIIIDKEVNLGMLKTCKTVEQYNAGCKIFGGNELSEEEFNLLKEWVK